MQQGLFFRKFECVLSAALLSPQDTRNSIRMALSQMTVEEKQHFCKRDTLIEFVVQTVKTSLADIPEDGPLDEEQLAQCVCAIAKTFVSPAQLPRPVFSASTLPPSLTKDDTTPNPLFEKRGGIVSFAPSHLNKASSDDDDDDDDVRVIQKQGNVAKLVSAPRPRPQGRKRSEEKEDITDDNYVPDDGEVYKPRKSRRRAVRQNCG